MLLVYLSATKASDNKNAVRAEIIHNGTKYEQTQLFLSETSEAQSSRSLKKC